MIRKAFYSLASALLLSGWQVGFAATAELRKVEITSAPQGAQVTLVLSTATSEKTFQLDGPDREVIDLRHTRRARGLRLPSADGLVTDIHMGAQPGGTLRLVIGMKGPMNANAVWLPAEDKGSARLVITLGQFVASEASTRPLKIARAAHAPGNSAREIVIAVDAGHGGQDPGAIGHRGTREKDVTLAIARALAERINGEPGMRAVLTRNSDVFLELRERIRRARAVKADMFISIHADSIVDRTISGASVYVLSEKGATSEAARWLADRENAADLMGGVKLDDKDNTLASVLLDLSQSANIDASMTAAEGVLSSLDGVGQVRKSQVQQAAFVVLKNPDIPSMLVETAYISNPSEELKLRTPRQQGKLADAIFVGVRSYFERNPPAGTRFAQERHSTIASVDSGLAATP
ncbi:MAG TPA: N-acetylmuramoyl-L-alanine amidase [Steroidobacteraceae bacterium]|nr:N-acetylmuramoyl-L-alanine amidase [Steroidobacteraceae bacterium]HXR92895.1 N-acetylmuramoyl-L-alanine amidase [Steroidobacteraceae bacterium]